MLRAHRKITEELAAFMKDSKLLRQKDTGLFS
jgi:hypothetical protein